MVAAIVAVDNNFGIGCKNELLAHIPADLKRFKELTTGHTVIMGRKTWESLPVKPLPNRTNCVLTHGLIETPEVWTLENLDEVHAVCAKEIGEESSWGDVFVIGGGMLYKELLPLCDKVYLTRIYKTFEDVDTFFPRIDLMDDWTLAGQSAIYEHDDFTYQFLEYDRI